MKIRTVSIFLLPIVLYSCQDVQYENELNNQISLWNANTINCAIDSMGLDTTNCSAIKKFPPKEFIKNNDLQIKNNGYHNDLSRIWECLNKRSCYINQLSVQINSSGSAKIVEVYSSDSLKVYIEDSHSEFQTISIKNNCECQILTKERLPTIDPGFEDNRPKELYGYFTYLVIESSYNKYRKVAFQTEKIFIE